MSRHNRFAPVFEYQFLHVTGAGTVVPVGLCVATTASTVVAPGSVQITPTSMANILPGMLLNIAGGTGTAEDVRVVSTTATTFTAVFANAHSGTYTISSRRGTFLSHVVINQAGTGNTLTLYNGNPNASYGSSVIAVVSPTASVTLEYEGACDSGLFYTLVVGSGAPDITITYLDMAA